MSKLTKRTFMTLSSAGFAVSVSPSAIGHAIHDDSILQIGEFFRTPESAQKIARHYLSVNADVTYLDVARSVERKLCNGDPTLQDISRAIREDFRQRNIVHLDGWVLSELEVELCVLAALEAV